MFVPTTNESARADRAAPRRAGDQAVPLGDDRVVDALQRLGADERDVVADAPPVDGGAGMVVPPVDPHDLPQGAVPLGQVLELVVVQVAAQADGGEHEDRPVVHPRPPAPAAGGTRAVDVGGDRLEDLVAQGGLGVDVAQGREDRDDLVAAVEVQHHVRHRRTAQPLLALHRLSHRVASSKIRVVLMGIPDIRTIRTADPFQSSRTNLREIIEKTRLKYVLRRTLD